MYKNTERFISYNSSLYEKLKISYEQAFKKPFLNQNVYESRFSFNGKNTSILLISKTNSKVL